jgi:AcrR family transcriptional regulator
MVTELSRRRVPAPERREQILAAARDLFVEQGVVSASMRAIAARVGITPTAIYDHFKDKEALLAAIAIGFFGDLVDAIAAAIAPEKTPQGRFKAMGRAYVKFGLDHPQEYRLLFMTPSAHLRRPSEKVEPTTDAYLMLERAVTELMDAGFIRKKEPRTVAEASWAMVHGLVALRITHATFEFSDLDDVLETALAMHLDALKP